MFTPLPNQTQPPLENPVGVWGNKERFNAIGQAVSLLPHYQEATGLGFKLVHNPHTCIRCRADIALLELTAIVNYFENEHATESEDLNNGS